MCLFAFAEKEVLPIITWDRTYGGSDDDVANCLIQTTDGGYAVAMAHSSKGVDGSIFLIMKVNAQDNLR